ncbi:uncharacterized protein LOC117332514 [Pecten maximus]|uniref:uncharacterized protein LOC117332514 n=1 Tax=Pecten maximus TaxID=6579 RepID=UPI001457E6C7|nr:uncharacterized protein LOC117332514 [Pecten maximus]
MESALYLFVLLVAVGIQTSQGELWEVSIYIDTRDYSESNDHLFMDVVGTVSNGSRLYLGNRFRNGETRQRVFNQNYGKVSHIRLYQSGKDGIRVQKVRMESVGGRMYTFRCDCWIQTDQPADDSKPSWLLKSEDCYWNDPIPHCATVVRVTCQTGKCDACVDGYHLDEGVCIGEQWEVSIYIDTRVNAQSNNQLFMDVLGTVSNDSRLYLGNNFRSGEISRKSFMLSRNIGIVNYIRLYQAGDDGLRVRKVRMESESGRMYIFRCDCWIQTDQPANDSRPSWLLQPEGRGIFYTGFHDQYLYLVKLLSWSNIY